MCKNDKEKKLLGMVHLINVFHFSEQYNDTVLKELTAATIFTSQIADRAIWSAFVFDGATCTLFSVGT